MNSDIYSIYYNLPAAKLEKKIIFAKLVGSSTGGKRTFLRAGTATQICGDNRDSQGSSCWQFV